MHERSIEWNTAQVGAKGGLLELRVPVAGEVSQRWSETFNAAARERGREARGQTWSDIHISGRWIAVEAVEPGAEGELRSYLDELVQITNHVADEVRDREDQAAKDRAEHEELHKGIAETMTERFRAPDG